MEIEMELYVNVKFEGGFANGKFLDQLLLQLWRF